MKPFKFIFLSFICFMSCKNVDMNKTKSGDLVIIGKDSFTVNVDTFRVIATNKSNPRNVLEEADPRYENLTDKGKVFFFSRPMPIGDTILTRTLIRIK